MVFRTRIEEARRLKETALRRVASMDAEIARATSERQRAEAAKRKSDEMLSKELQLRKEGEAELKEAQRALASDTERADAAKEQASRLKSAGAKTAFSEREKDEILARLEELQQVTAETDQLQLQLKRRF